ncbi:hypothetical protein ASPTUDRAFT_26711 [Aspergillus tubingensis CBS 134.48]|uniref:Uncharacterized protein n=1 Tax=Aspergillus tubingensis (strain CBS 134.48) TaxID=767770 RepID=A0A1L9NPM9_ASPTC|nr:hypothetical protein ASPTUDRAFT_26711 [Aspergillus tubingensis CBS 134.48]
MTAESPKLKKVGRDVSPDKADHPAGASNVELPRGILCRGPTIPWLASSLVPSTHLCFQITLLCPTCPISPSEAQPSPSGEKRSGLESAFADNGEGFRPSGTKWQLELTTQEVRQVLWRGAGLRKAEEKLNSRQWEITQAATRAKLAFLTSPELEIGGTGLWVTMKDSDWLRGPLVYRSFPERDGLQYFRAGPVAPSQSIVTANLFMCLLCPRTSNWILIFSTQLEQG